MRTGQTGYSLAFGRELFEHLADNEELAANFDRAMTALYSAETDAVVRGFDFGGVQRLMDVGGGNGSTLVWDAASPRSPHPAAGLRVVGGASAPVDQGRTIPVA